MENPFNQIMQQAQKVQEQIGKVQDELARAELVGESGAGLVKIVMTGRHDVKKVEIDSSLMSEEKQVLEDLIAAAINDAVYKVEKHNQGKMASLTGGLDLQQILNMKPQ